MKEERQNKMAIAPMNKLILKMGLPMIISMVLQALYNVIDSIFVANMGVKGAIANQTLTYAFPIQIMIIAIGVGTGVGLNAILSKSLGENDKEKVNKIAGNGIFLSICIYIVFLLFGLFGSKWFISLFTSDKEIIEMGTIYLKICTCLSLGSIGYTVYERFLQATGKTMLSTISQISGAITNIVLDYIFIYPLNMGIEAWPVDNFVKDNDFAEKTVIPFCTSASSGLGQSGRLLEDISNGGNWQEGHRFSSSVSTSDIKLWTDSLY